MSDGEDTMIKEAAVYIILMIVTMFLSIAGVLADWPNMVTVASIILMAMVWMMIGFEVNTL